MALLSGVRSSCSGLFVVLLFLLSGLWKQAIFSFVELKSLVLQMSDMLCMLDSRYRSLGLRYRNELAIDSVLESLKCDDDFKLSLREDASGVIMLGCFDSNREE